MIDYQDDFNLFKEMMIVFIIGGALGLFLLVIALSVVEFLKR